LSIAVTWQLALTMRPSLPLLPEHHEPPRLLGNCHTKARAMAAVAAAMAAEKQESSAEESSLMSPTAISPSPFMGRSEMSTSQSFMRMVSSSSTFSFVDEDLQLQSLGLPPAEVIDFVQNGAMSLHWVGPDGKILWANRDELNTFGYEAEEYIGKNIAEFHADQDVLSDIIRRLKAGETLRDVPARMIHREGTIVHVEINSSAYMDVNQCLMHTRCFTRNVTARKLAEIEREKHVAEESAKVAEETAALLEHLSLRLRQEVCLQQCLLHRMLPPKVAEDLRAGRRVPPEAFDHVTIFFSDIEGFTKIAAAVEPIDIVHLLNVLYIVMDYCASRFPVYKVETIGDAYMVVGGLPEPALGDEHAAAVADFALLTQQAVQLVAHPLKQDTAVRLRMGIHSGPVVAGVVGNLMPRYCLFGDTVNTASRMESTGEACRIHCSGSVAELLRRIGGYALEPRGQIEVKGKGSMETMWLNSGPEGPHPEGFLKHVRELIAEAPKKQPYSLLVHDGADDFEAGRISSLRSEHRVGRTTSLLSSNYTRQNTESVGSLPSLSEVEPISSLGTSEPKASTACVEDELQAALEVAEHELATRDAEIEKLTRELSCMRSEGVACSPTGSDAIGLGLGSESPKCQKPLQWLGELMCPRRSVRRWVLLGRGTTNVPPSLKESEGEQVLPGGGSWPCLLATVTNKGRLDDARSEA